jgi:hypothetical protein
MARPAAGLRCHTSDTYLVCYPLHIETEGCSAVIAK